MSWGVRRNEDDSKDPANEGPRRPAMSVGEWLNSVETGKRPVRLETPAITELDQRLDDLNQRLKRLSDPAKQPSRDAHNTDELSEIAAALGRLSGESRKQPVAEPEARRANPIHARLDEIDRRLADMTRGSDRRGDRTTPTRSPLIHPGDNPSFDEVARMRRGLRDIEDLRPKLSPEPARFERTREFERSREPLDDTSQLDRQFRRLSNQMTDLHAASTKDLAVRLDADIRALRQSIESRLGSGGMPRSSDSDMNEIRAIAQRVEQLAADRHDPRQIERLFGELERLRESVLDANVAGSLRSLEAGYGHVVSRLDELKRGLADPRLIEHIGAEVGQVRDALRVLPAAGEFGQIERRIQALSGKLDEIHASSERSSQADPMLLELKKRIESLDPAHAIRKIDQQLQSLSEKIDTIETASLTRAQAVTSAHDERLSGLFDRMTTLATGAQSRTSDDLKALDRRLAEISTRIGDIEGRGASRSDISDMARMIDAIAAKIERPVHEPAKPVIPPALIDLDIRIERLNEKLDRLESGSGTNRQITALESEIAALRMDLAQSTGGRGNGQLEAQIRSLGERIERMDSASRLPEQAIADIIDRALKRFELQTADVSSQRGDLASFEKRMAHIVEVLDRLAGSDNALDQQIEALEREVAAMRRDLSKIAAPVRDSELEDQLRRLTLRLEANTQAGPDNRVVAQITEQIGRIAEQLSEHERRFADTGAIASKLGALEVLLSARREDAIEAATQAARDAVREFADYAAGAKFGGGDLQALESDLRSVKDVTRSSEVRTTEALQSVHDALTTIVGRLGALERTKSEEPAPSHTRARPIEPAAPSFEDHRPLEPGSGKPRIAPTAAAPTVQRADAPPPPPAIATQGARLDPQSGKVIPLGEDAETQTDPALAAPKRTDFIAAARRAAQAAAQNGGRGPVPPPMSAEPHPVALHEQPEAPSPSVLGRLSAMLKGRSVAILAVGGLIIVVGTTMPFILGGTTRVADRGPQTTRDIVASTQRMPTAIDQATPATARIDRTSDTPPGYVAPPEATQADLALTPPSAVTSTFVPQKRAQTGDVVAMLDKTAADPTITQSLNPATPTATSTSEIPSLQMPTDKIGSLALRTAAATGDPKAQFEVGMRFAEGRGVPADLAEATRWYERAAAQGFIPAAYRLGSAYEKALGVTRDVGQAKRWYQTAGEGGNIRAMHNLGVLYANERDMVAALPWFQKAADAGLKDSQFNLGIIFALGTGVKQDLAQSYKWFSLAGVQGDQEATKKRDDIATHLDKAALAAAKLAVSTWKPKQITRDSNEEVAVWSEPASTPAPIGANTWTQTMKVQSLLAAKGLYNGPLDGSLTPATKAAVRAFQKKAGFRQNGEIDDSLMAALASR